jgi:predicted PurR-regulated permease PerM
VAAVVVAASGMRAIPDIIGPVFLAVVLTITVDPIRGMVMRWGAPRWLATLAVVIAVYAIVIGLMVGVVVGVAQFATLMPQYADQIQAQLASFSDWLTSIGLSQQKIQDMVQSIDTSKLVTFAENLLAGATGALSEVLLVLVLVLFLAADGAVFTAREAKYRAGREPVLNALDAFAKGTRKYFGVATVFGGIVAVLDGIGLLILGIPAAGLWALLAFITNYIPNIGFVIGLIPPAILGLLIGGPGLMIAVIVLYCVLNLIIQSVIQPKFVGDAVGLTTSMSFLSLIVWAYIMGPLGAILAVPASLLVKALLVDMDPSAQWMDLFLGDKPEFPEHDPKKPRRGLRRQPRQQLPPGNQPVTK